MSQKYLLAFTPAASGSFCTPEGTSPEATGPGVTSIIEVPASEPTSTTDHQYYLCITSATCQGLHHWWDNKSDWFIEQAETRGAHRKKKTQHKINTHIHTTITHYYHLYHHKCNYSLIRLITNLPPGDWRLVCQYLPFAIIISTTVKILDYVLQKNWNLDLESIHNSNIFYKPHIKGHKAKACALTVIRHNQHNLLENINILYMFIFCGLSQCNEMQQTWKLPEYLRCAKHWRP